jgi:integrase
MRAKITKRSVDTLEEGVLWDPELRGFGVRARPPGGKFYVLKFRSGRKQRWHTIGRHGSPWTPEQARKEARRILGELATGKRPASEARATVAAAIEGFIEAHTVHLRSGDQTARLLRRHVTSRWGTRKIASIEHRDVVALLHEVQGDDRTKRASIANKVRAALSRFFKWAISEALVPSRENPVAGTEPRRGEITRERVLTNEEIGRVWKAADSFPFGAIVRLLLATGQRRNEISGMRWSELDLEKRTWRLPKERTKGNREHFVPLNDLAIKIILIACPRIEGSDLIFATRKKQAAFCGWSQAKHRLDAKSGVQDWRLHDLRRTVATGMQAAEVLPHTVAAVLNHSTAGLFGVTAIYLRDRQEEAKRAAMSAWDRRLRDILETPT